MEYYLYLKNMAKIPVNHRKPITPEVVEKVRNLANHNTPTRVIGLKIGRTPDAVYSIASDNDISLRPTNQSPYGTANKK
jgi:hypothetical protein